MRLCNAAEKDEINISLSYHGYCLKAPPSWGVFLFVRLNTCKYESAQLYLQPLFKHNIILPRV